jgi:demethylmenaquinone methyltransferase/2-methoxy-6-polyprenyl-1,4-benzoquinol methylase
MFGDVASGKPHPKPSPAIPVWSRALGSWNVSISRRPFEPAELEHHYDRTADVWQSKVERLGFVDAYHQLIAFALRDRQLSDNGMPLQVMDAGVGTGAMSQAFSNLVSCDVDLLGVDISQQMLKRARRTVHKPNVSMQTLKADLGALPLEDNTFDLILMAHVVEHLADPVPVLAELRRVLKPGGMMICCITRRSRFGRYIQLVWRTHQVDAPIALSWMQRAGFTSSRMVPLDKRTGTRARSLGYVAKKELRLSAQIG